jgi:hypothetical protein
LGQAREFLGRQAEDRLKLVCESTNNWKNCNVEVLQILAFLQVMGLDFGTTDYSHLFAGMAYTGTGLLLFARREPSQSRTHFRRNAEDNGRLHPTSYRADLVLEK